MLAVAATKATAQWVTQRCSQVVTSEHFAARSGEYISTTTTLTPIIIAAGAKRCWAGPALTYTGRRRFGTNHSHTTSTPLQRTASRIHHNVARLYARRILELAAASAAVQRFVVQLEANHEPPVDWKDWQRREWSQELLESLGDHRITRLWAATKRIFSLSCLVAPFAVLYPLSLVSEKVEALSWKYALWGIERAGPTYIKLFQWATTRQDLFTPEFCRYFGKLQDETVGHAWKETVKILEEDLGLPVASTTSVKDETIFNVNRYLDLEKTPIGSGCIAQVYRGTLKQAVGKYAAGTEVAIKVQHPGIWHKVCVDFYIMGLAARWLESVPMLNLKYLSLADTVRKFRDIMLPQLDLILEAKHLQRFNRDFANDSTISFPEPLTELTSTRVLTETFVHGTPILHFTKAPEADRKELALLGLTATLKMIFLNDFLHGDLHPGNILVSRDKSLPGHPLRLHLLDCGLVVEMGPEQHINLVKILGAFARRNGRLAGQLMVDTSSDSQASDIDVELFVMGIEHIVKDDENNNFLEKVGDYITDICYLACQRKVKLEASFINAALAVEIMEGIATALYPHIQVTKVAMPLVVQAELMHRLPKFSLW